MKFKRGDIIGAKQFPADPEIRGIVTRSEGSMLVISGVQGLVCYTVFKPDHGHFIRKIGEASEGEVKRMEMYAAELGMTKENVKGL